MALVEFEIKTVDNNLMKTVSSCLTVFRKMAELKVWYRLTTVAQNRFLGPTC
jgi:hypothetical protein